MPSADPTPDRPPPLPPGFPRGPGLARSLARPWIFCLAALLWLSTFVFTADRLALPTCAFLRWTGRPCPGCGMTHALVEISHGRFRDAFALHPLAFAVYPVIILFALGFLIPPFGRFLRSRLVRHDRAFSALFLAFLLALIVFGGIRFFGKSVAS